MKQGKAKIYAISFGHFIHDVYTAFLAPVLPLLIENLKLSYFQAGLLSVIRSLPAAFNAFIGLLADKKDFRIFVIIAPSVSGILMSLMGLAPNYIVLVLMLFAVGINSTLFHIPTPVMIRKVSPDKLGFGMSMYMLGGELARTIGPLTILAGVSLWGFEGTYRLIPLSLATSFLMWIQIRKISIHRKKESKGKPAKIKLLLKQHGRLFIMITGFMLFTSLMKSALSVFLPTFKNEQGASLWIGGINLAIYQFAGALGTFGSGTLSDKFGRRRILLIAAIANPILMAAFVFFQDSVASTGLLVLIGASLLSYGSVLLAMVQEIKTDRPAFLNGIYMTINFFVSSIGAMFIGFFSDLFSMTETFYLAAFLALLAVPFIFFLPKNK
jgi:FSR family fosmidomycin resistance protein-like MFS transporter